MMTEAVVLAGGLSRRTGERYKMTLDLGGKTVLERSVESVLPYCDRVIVVTGGHHEELASILSRYHKVTPVFNRNFETGMFSSVKAGIARVTAHRFFVLPGDCPLIPGAVFESLLAQDEDILIPTYRGLPGHPVLLKSEAGQKILQSRERSLRDALWGERVTKVETGCSEILFDLDTMEDYEWALMRFQKGVIQ